MKDKEPTINYNLLDFLLIFQYRSYISKLVLYLFFKHGNISKKKIGFFKEVMVVYV
jgi:hypothetical protein